jgi:hypothetical protein
VQGAQAETLRLHETRCGGARSGSHRPVQFVRGQPVAADAVATLTATKVDDATTLRAGTDERCDIADAVLTGG